MCECVSSSVWAVQRHRNIVQKYFNTISAGGLLSGSLGLQVRGDSTSVTPKKRDVIEFI